MLRRQPLAGFDSPPPGHYNPTMVRVHFEAREPVDYPTANEAVIGNSGTLTLNECQIAEMVDPNTFQKVSGVVGRLWLATWWPGSGLLYAEKIDEVAAGPPALEVAR